MFIRWIDFEFAFVQRNTVLLVFDSARAHIAARVKTHLHNRGILFVVIPGGLTPHLQPCDVSWFKPLKERIKESIDRWKASPNHEQTRFGNPRPPTTEDMMIWLSAAWTSISVALIRNSFERCFLGESLFLHIARNEVYGEQFRVKLAELAGGHETIEDVEVSEDSDPLMIDDE